MINSQLTSLWNGIPRKYFYFLIGLIILIAWLVGGDSEEENQDEVIRLLMGIYTLMSGFSQLIRDILIIIGRGILWFLNWANSALRRVGKFIEENVTIVIHLGGTFWRLILVVILISTGALTLSTLAF